MTASKQIQQITTKALFYKNNKILFVKEHKGKWELPGGRILFGESPEDALRREIKEELGFSNIKINDIIHIWTFLSNVKDINYQFVVLVYNCFTDEMNIIENKEYAEAKWIELGEVNNLNMRNGYKQTVKKFMEDVNNDKL